MATSAHSCVVTGYGFVGPQGKNVSRLLSALQENRSGIRPITLFDTSPFSAHLGGEIPSEALQNLPLPLQKADRANQMVWIATEEAVQQARLPLLPDIQKEEVPIILGTTLGGMLSATQYLQEFEKKGAKHAPVSRLRDFLPSSQSHTLAHFYGFNGQQVLITNACASGANAIGYAKQLIQQGLANIVLAGGYDPLSLFTFAGFNSLKLLAPELCRPFDRHRQGLNLGEGAGILVLESELSAQKRGVPILARVVGYGESIDAFHLTQPDPSGRGALRAMQSALNNAQLTPSEIDYINAHGTATFHNDLMESCAISELFHTETPVSSTKSFTGHLLGASGAVEAIISVLALQHQFLPKNLNLEEKDPELRPIQLVAPNQSKKIRYVLSNSFGFGGVNASLIFESFLP